MAILPKKIKLMFYEKLLSRESPNFRLL